VDVLLHTAGQLPLAIAHGGVDVVGALLQGAGQGLGPHERGGLADAVHRVDML